MKYKFLLPAAFILSAHCASAATIIAFDNFTGATQVDGSSFTTNQTTSNSNWATNLWTNGFNRDIRTSDYSGAGTTIKLRNRDSFLERTIDLSTYDGTDITISFKYGHVDVEGGEQLNVQFDFGDGNSATLDDITLPGAGGTGGSPIAGLFDYSHTFTFNEVGTGLQAIRLVSDVNDNPDSFSVDDITLTAIPEPSSSILLLSVCGFGLLMRRR